MYQSQLKKLQQAFWTHWPENEAMAFPKELTMAWEKN